MKKTISIITLCTLVLSISGCAKEGTSEPVVTTTAPIYVQEDGYQTTAATEASEPTVESDESKSEDKPIPAVKDNDFNLDGVYNTTIENNISDDIVFEVVIEHTAEDGTITREVVTLNDNTSYADLAVNLSSFGMITTEDILEHDVDSEYWHEQYSYKFYGIGHNISISPEIAAPALYLELVDDEGIVTDTTPLNSNDFDVYNPSVKAIAAKLYTKSAKEDDNGYLIQRTPVTVYINAILPTETINLRAGMYWWATDNIGSSEIIGGNHYRVLKNTNYTLVIMRDDTYDEYIGDIVLIKN